MRLFILYCFFSTVLTAYSQASMDTAQANNCFSKAELFFSKSNHDSSIYYFEKASKIYQKAFKNMANTGSYKVLVQKHITCLNKVAENYYRLQQLEQALQISEEALKSSKRYLSKANDEEANAYKNIGAIYLHRGQYDAAIEAYQRGLSIKRTLYGDKHWQVAHFYNLIGLLYHSKGVPEQALDFLRKAQIIRQLVHGEKHHDVAASYFSIGNVYFSKNDFDAALEQYQLSLNIYKELNGEKDINVARCYNNIGLTYRHKKSYNQALEHYQKSLSIKREVYGEKHPDLADTYNNIGNIYKTKGSYSLALRQYQKAICANMSDFNDTTSTEINPTQISKCYDQEYLLTSFQNKARVLETIYELSTNPKNLKVALQTFLVCDKLIEKMRLSVTAETDKVALEKKAEKMYESAVRVCYSLYRIYMQSNREAAQEYYAKSFYFSEKNKYSIMMESILEVAPKTYNGVPDSLLSLEKSYQTNIVFYHQKLAEKPSADLETIYQQKLAEAEQNYGRLINTFKDVCPRYYGLKYDNSTVSVSELQSLLNKETALIEYFINDHTLYVFTITAKDYTVDTLSVAQDLAVRMEQSILRRNHREYISAASRLYQTLFPRALPRNIEKLIIIPEGFLRTLPFSALLTEPVSADTEYNRLPYMVRKYSISYIYSVGLFYRSSQHHHVTTDLRTLPAASATRGFAGYAPVFSQENQQQVFASGAQDVLLTHDQADTTVTRAILQNGRQISPLPVSRVEVERIADLFGAEKIPGKTYTDLMAREETVKSSGMRNYEYLHFATHSFISEKNPAYSGIVLTQEESSREDGILQTDEIYNLDLDAKLVVLSACETELGRVSKGEGMNAFTRAFFYAGAKNMMFSLWKVADHSTVEMMMGFYDQLLVVRGDDVAYSEVLRKAKLQMISGKKHAAPYYWASFILLGR